MSRTFYQRYVAVYLIARDNDTVLLSRRFNTGWMDGRYSLPAGHVEEGETIERAMAREAKEEIGIDIDPKDLSVVHVMHRQSGEREYIDFFLTAKKWRGTPQNVEPDKCDQIAWFPANALPPATLEYIAQALDNSAKGEPFSSFGF